MYCAARGSVLQQLRWAERIRRRTTAPIAVRFAGGSRYVAIWSGKMPLCPNEMVPLQIDLAIVLGRYLGDTTANPARAVSLGPSMR
jgi:DUF917 family protein